MLDEKETRAPKEGWPFVVGDLMDVSTFFLPKNWDEKVIDILRDVQPTELERTGSAGSLRLYGRSSVFVLN